MWVMAPKNDVERLGLVLVTERSSSANKYLCTKCLHRKPGGRGNNAYLLQ